MNTSKLGNLRTAISLQIGIIGAMCLATVFVVCGSAPASAADSTIFVITLDGATANACAGSGSDRTGFAICVLNSDSTQLSVHVEHNIVLGDLLGGHIHNGSSCINGPIVFPLGGLASPIDVIWAIDPTNVQRLFDGDLYINFHTDINASGEIRGQIVQETRKYSFTLDESQINTTTHNRTFSHNNGVALCRLNADATQLQIRLCHDVPPPFGTGLHVHSGLVGAEGPVEYFVFDPSTSVNVTWFLEKQDLINLFNDSLYLNLHSGSFVDGEVRGQIVQEELRFVFPMNGAQAKSGAGSGSDHKGFAILTLSKDGSEVSVYAEHDIPFDSADAGHIHLGIAGNNGAVLHSLTSAVSPISETWVLADDVEFEQLINGQIYMDIETPENPTGAIRGQSPGVKDTSQTKWYPSCDVTIDEDQAAACVGTGSSYNASGFVELKKGGRQLNVSVTHDISVDSILAGHIHNAPECANGVVSYTFLQADEPSKEIWYLTESDIVNLMRNELYINLHTELFPAGELRGQIGKNQGCCNAAGDFDHNGSFNIADVTAGIARIFAGGPAPVCQDEGDSDGDNTFNIADVTYGIARIFGGGPAPICGTTGF